MHSILLVFEEPDDLPENRKKWDDLSKYARSISKKDGTIEELNKGVLLIQTDSTLASLQGCLCRAEGLKYKYAIFPDGIVWRGIDQGSASRR